MTDHKHPLTVIIEEHHEAYYVWSYAIRNGRMSPSGNTLLHVDDHPDLELPFLRSPQKQWLTDREAAEFTYNELDIACFIWPAVYQGIFNRIVWMRQIQPVRRRHRMGYIRSRDSSELEYMLRWAGKSPIEVPEDARPVELSLVEPEGFIRTDQPAILDIDLDFFGSNRYLRGNFEIEVTASSYHAFVGSPYHFLKLGPSEKVTAQQRNGSYFLKFYDYPAGLDDRHNESTVAGRITAFCDSLDRNGVVPPVIIICRSVFSGYTPAETADFAQSFLLEKLRDRFGVNPVTIAEILPRETALAATSAAP